MGLRLTVRRRAWHAAVQRAAASLAVVVPVVKGNGYGFGRATLMPVAAELSGPDGRIAVGTVYEAGDVPADRTALVLTPHLGELPPTVPPTALLTAGHADHVAALAAAGWRGRIVVKLASSMRRYGATLASLDDVTKAAHAAHLEIAGYAIHLDLAGSADDHVAEVEGWLAHLDPVLPLSLSHVDAASLSALRAAHPACQFDVRAGTALWHADKSLLHLTADVLDVHDIAAGDRAGYRATPVPGDGSIALAAAGSAHGVLPLDDGRSPFHFARQRIAMLEPPHMHTTMLFIPAGSPSPGRGDRVDVQRPLTMVSVDELTWLDD